MTDAFQHPDGHTYRFLGFGPDAMKGDGPFYDTTTTNKGIKSTVFASMEPVFERVEPPLWPWTGPSGCAYEIEGGVIYSYHSDGTSMQYIPAMDFAGLAERLAKQAELNKERA